LIASSGKSDFGLFTEYPGKQDFLQLSNIPPSPGCLPETGHNPYNLPAIFGRAKWGLSCFPNDNGLKRDVQNREIDTISMIYKN
jgi:hypothetical protein